MQKNGIELVYRSYEENILFDFNPNIFDIDTILQTEDTKVEITQKCTICSHLKIFHKHLPKIIKKHEGLHYKMLTEGNIKANLKVYQVIKLKKSFIVKLSFSYFFINYRLDVFVSSDFLEFS